MSDYDNMIQGGYEDVPEVEQLKDSAKNLAQKTVSKGGARAAKGLLSLIGKAFTALVQALLANPIAAVVIALVLVFVLIIFVVVAEFKAPIRDYFLAVKEKLLFPVVVTSPSPYLNQPKFLAWSEYDDPDYEKRLEGEQRYSFYPGDPDHTDQILSGLNLAISGDEAASEKFGYLLTDQNLWHSQEDILEILDTCSRKNMLMFEESKVRYQYHTWTNALHVVPETGLQEWGWEEGLESTAVMTDPDGDGPTGWYGEEARIDIEGEKDKNGLHRFQMHWPEILAYIEIASWGSYENWATNKDDYDPGRLFKDPSNVDGYYLLYDEFKELLDMFEYKFQFKWDSVADGEDNFYEYPKLERGEYTIGYHFKKDEPDSILDKPLSYEYTWLTRYVPEAAPDKIYNGWETVQYVYTNIDNVPNYLPAGDTYKPPEGVYCAGRWTTVDPRPFIDTMSEYCQYYRANSDDYAWLDAHGYEYDEKLRDYTMSIQDENWVDRMISHYLEWLNDLPYAASAGRPDLFQQLADDYNEKVIRVSYEGTKTPEFGDQLDALYRTYSGCTLVFPLAEGASDDGLYPEGWTVKVDDADLGIDEWLEVPDDLSGMPFHSYGVTFHRGGDDPDSPDDPPEPYKPRPPVVGGKLWISQQANSITGKHYVVDFWIELYEGAETDLCVSDNLSAAQIKRMLEHNWKGTKVDSMEVAEVLKEVQDRQGISIAGVLAIMRTERSGKSIGEGPGAHNNFFDVSGEPHYDGTTRWRDYSMYTVPEAMRMQVEDFIVKRYWKNGQNTFYTMTFNKYGYPQNWDEAEAAKPGIYHSYCPWWDNPAYTEAATNETSGHPELPTYSETAWTNLWCNRCAEFRSDFLAAAGAGG